MPPQIGDINQGLIPGDPARVSLGLQATDELVAQRRENMGLDRPVIVQYVSWVTDAAQGDFGRSLLTGQSVSELLGQRLPATLQLAALALIFGVVVALPLGIVSAMRPNSPVDLFASVLSQLGVAVPDFWMAILLVLRAEVRTVSRSRGFKVRRSTTSTSIPSATSSSAAVKAS